MKYATSGGLGSNNVIIIEKTGWSVDIQDIENHQITGVPIITNGAIFLIRGPFINILHQYAYIGHEKAIHSSG